MREVVRSGRRANFYITENSFIDHYARDVGTTGVAVYHVLERHANCETRSTWIGTAKVAELLNLDQRTIQRTIKKLESLKLIRIVRSANVTTYFIVPVPPPAKTTPAPLFDQISEVLPVQGNNDVMSATPQSQQTTTTSSIATSTPLNTTLMPQASDIPVAVYKEEQNLLNKNSEQEGPQERIAAERIVNILGLPPGFVETAAIAVRVEARQTGLSTDEVVTSIVTAANRAKRKGAGGHDRFLFDFVAQACAQQITEDLNLSATNSVISTVAAALQAEAKHRGVSTEKAAEFIQKAALEDRGRGIPIDKFYFEDLKWRNANGNGQGKSTAERNLDAAIDARNAARRALGLDH